MEMEKVKLGIIGAGIVVQDLYYQELKQIQNRFEVVAIASGDQESADACRKLFQAKRTYLDYRQLLADKEVEAVCVAYPFTMNHEIVCAALDAGKHVMVEKPIATSLEDAREMVKKAADSERVCLLAENFRYRRFYAKVRELLEEGAIGKVSTFIWNLISFTPRTLKYVSKSTWRLNSHYGLLFDGSVHFISGFREMFGEIKSAVGAAHQMREDMGTNDMVTYQMLFESGVTGTYHMFQSSVGYANNDAVIFGSKGTMKLEGLRKMIISTDEETYTVELEGEDEGYMAEFLDYYDCIQNHKTPKSSFEQGYRDFLADVVAFAPLERWDALRLEEFDK